MDGITEIEKRILRNDGVGAPLQYCIIIFIQRRFYIQACTGLEPSPSTTGNPLLASEVPGPSATQQTLLTKITTEQPKHIIKNTTSIGGLLPRFISVATFPFLVITANSDFRTINKPSKKKFCKIGV